MHVIEIVIVLVFYEPSVAAGYFFPNLDKLPGWTVRAVSEPVTENGLTYRFYDYVNTKLCD